MLTTQDQQNRRTAEESSLDSETYTYELAEEIEGKHLLHQNHSDEIKESTMTLTVEEQEKYFSWEADPLYFIFNNEIPGKVRMHTKRMEWENWIKIDKTYPAQMQLRHELLKSTKDTVFVTNESESTNLAKQELLEKVVSYLPERFPDKFEKREGGIYNKILDETISTDPNDPVDPIIRAGNLTQEDWVILEWDEELDSYKLTAGIVYFPMRWSLLEKWNRSMPGIHQPVKGFMKHLVKNVQSLFKAMTPAAPVWRANWAVFNDLRDPLDLYTPTGHTDRNETNQVTAFEGDSTGKKLTFRAEYQTLVKLPESQAIVFSIRTYQRYLSDFKECPLSDAKGLIKAIQTLDPDFYVYKGAEFWKDAAVEYLQHIVKERENSAPKSNKSFLSYMLLGSGLAVGAIACVAFFKLRN